jgi:hypothetical protein
MPSSGRLHVLDQAPDHFSDVIGVIEQLPRGRRVDETGISRDGDLRLDLGVGTACNGEEPTELAI